MRIIADVRIAALLLLALLGAVAPAMAQDAPPRVVLFEDPSFAGNRTHYPLLIAGGRGFRMACTTQADEERLIHGLGFTVVPSEILSAVSPDIVAARPDENPLLCPSADNYKIKVFAAQSPEGPKYYLQFPAAIGNASYGERLYVPGCVELTNALNLDLTAAQQADPTPFFEGKIHEITCISGTFPPPVPTTFAEWCMKSDRSAAEAATVMAMLDATPQGVSSIGSAAACGEAQSFLAGVPTLDLTGKGVQSLAPLAVLPSLTSLVLASNDIGDIAPLAKLTLLQRLDLSHNHVAKVVPLATLSALTSLSLSDNRIADIRTLSALVQLTELHLDTNTVSDLTPLQFLPALRRLSLASNGLTGDMLEPLTALGALAELNVSNNSIADFDTLAAFPSTLKIDVTGNPIGSAATPTFLELCILHRDDASPYGHTVRQVLGATGVDNCAGGYDALMASTALNLSGKIVSDIRPLGVLTHLTDLDLSNNAISDIGPLSGLVRLNKLNLTANTITDIRPVAPLLSLLTLQATGNPVLLDDFLSACLMRNQEAALAPAQAAEVAALLTASGQSKCQPAADDLAQRGFVDVRNMGLTSVNYFGILRDAEAIDVSDNQVADLSSFRDLPALVRIAARGNNITSLAPIRQLRSLEELNLSNNPIPSLAGIADLNKLRRLNISGTGIRSVLPLADLPRLESAELRNLPLNYDSLREYCLVNRFDPIALGNARSFMLALQNQLAADHIDLDDCEAVETWAGNQTILTLNKKSITSVAPIAFFRSLRELNLFDNSIEDVGPIASLTGLTKLNLASNHITTLPRFGSLALHDIYLGNNTISDLRPLSNLGALASIEARFNRITTMQPLTANGGLTSIDVRSNQIEFPGVVSSLMPKTWLASNPVCNTGFVMVAQVVNEACNRRTFVFTPIDIDNQVLVQPSRNMDVLRPCGTGGSGNCAQILVRPFETISR